MKSRTTGKILKAPFVLLGVASVVASIYATWKKIAGINYETIIFMTLIFGLYIWGEYLMRRKKDDDWDEVK